MLHISFIVCKALTRKSIVKRSAIENHFSDRNKGITP